jgi:putative ATP-binding cassette transporter
MKRFSQLLRDAWWLTKPYFTSEDRWPALALLAVLVGLNLGQVYLSVVFNQWNNVFYTALQEKDWPVFIHQMIRFCWLAALFIIAAVYQLYFNQMLQIRWRQWLTRRYLDQWLDRRAYYRMPLANGGTTDNPDQRIADDLRLFVQQTLGLSLGMLSAVVTLLSFLAILWGLSGTLSFSVLGHPVSIPGYMVWVAFAYAFLGTWLTNLIGRRLIQLNFDQQRYEADFRFSLVRVRENADAIALDAGEASEKQGLVRRFVAVATNWWGIMRAQKRLTWFTAGYNQIAIVFPFAVASPQYFFGNLQLGGLMQTASAFGQVQTALSFIINSYAELAQWTSVVDRLAQFRTSMRQSNETAAGLDVRRTTGSEIVLDDVRIDLPDGESLLTADRVALQPRQAVLVSGPSGSGKSTLFRAIAGTWPFGEGRVRLPADAKLMFLPQRPYLPVGPLRQVLTYPQAPDDTDDQRLREVLGLANLPHLQDRLDEERHWSQSLSPGEQQRVAFARAFLHKPDWLFVDEATAALDEAAERDLYSKLARVLPGTTVVSIGHRSTLREFHVKHLALAHSDRGTRARLSAPHMTRANGLLA